MLRRAIAMSEPGMFLSQAATATRPSMLSPKHTVSMESAMTSRLTRDAFMPSVPMEMPSLTVMVPKRKGKPLARRTPSLTAWATRSRCTLQGVTSLARLATAMNARSMSSSFIPTARSIDRAGARWGPSVTMRLLCFTSCLVVVIPSLLQMDAMPAGRWRRISLRQVCTIGGAVRKGGQRPGTYGTGLSRPENRSCDRLEPERTGPRNL